MSTPTILEQIRKVVEAWKREDIATLAAMDMIDGILRDAEKVWQRRKTISDAAGVMMETLLPFGESNVATVHPSGLVEVRLNQKQRTLTSRMSIGEFAAIAKIVFMNVRNDISNDEKKRDLASDVNGKLMNFVQEWSD